MPHLLFTGGGTAGHVMPNIALMEEAGRRGWRVSYAGSAGGIERELIAGLDVPFHALASGKLRRYFSWRNFIDPFRVLLGVFQGLRLCRRLQPDVVFSKGGFVSVPVVVAAWLSGIPVISHESDVTPGLANRLACRFCRRICVTFEETAAYLPPGKVLVTGTPVRRALLRGNRQAGLDYLGLPDDKPLLLVLGGSTGAEALNARVRSVLASLLETFNVAHVTGADHLDPLYRQAGYVQKAFIGEAFGDVLAAATVVVSRAGANALYELLVTRKPHLLVPLTRAASRGDQLDNAAIFGKRGYSRVLSEDRLNDGDLLRLLREILEQRAELERRLAGFEVRDSVGIILNELQRYF